MPSPVGHALGGMVAGWLVARPVGRSAGEAVRSGAWLAVLGMAPDIDLLFTQHRGPSHSVSAAVLAGLAVAAITRRPRLGAAAACAYASHVFLDWLGADTAAPFGVMALWPASYEFYLSRLDIFAGVERHYRPGFWLFNIKALARELIILGPLAWVVVRRRWTAGGWSR